jgi:uncharacterized protein with HEPN domain
MRRDRLFIADKIAAATRAIEIASSGSVAEIMADPLRHGALKWNFIVLGEGSARISAEIKQKTPLIAWKEPTWLRNKIVHMNCSLQTRQGAVSGG